MELVSIIIPTYHGEEHLSRAVNSALAQTWENVEIIVVDDNDPKDPSRNATEVVMRRFSGNNSVRYIKHEYNKNGAAARNTGMRAANGTYIAFLDDDDCYTKDRIKKCVTALKENPENDGVLTSVLQMKGEYCINIARIQQSNDMKRELMLNKSLLGSGSNVFITRNAADMTGDFDEKFRRHQDLEYMIRFFRSFKVFVLPDVLCVKFTDRTENNPHYKDMCETKMMFIDKFRKDVDDLTEADKKNFYIHHYEHLFNIALYSGTADDLDEATGKLQQYRKLSSGEKMRIRMAKCRVGSSNLLELFRRIKLNLNHSRLITNDRKIRESLHTEVTDIIGKSN